jgi:hypothetical protein
MSTIQVQHKVEPVDLGSAMQVCVKIIHVAVDPPVTLQDDASLTHDVFRQEGATVFERAAFGTKYTAAQRATALGVPCTSDDVELLPGIES